MQQYCCKRNLNDELYPLSLPWNQRALFGWITEVFFSAIALASYLLVNVAFLTLFGSLCEYHRAFYQMFQDQMNRMDELHQNNDIKQQLHQSILHHGSVQG